jgi:hypothetical protein
MKITGSSVLPVVAMLAAAFGYVQSVTAKNYLCNQQLRCARRRRAYLSRAQG